MPKHTLLAIEFILGHMTMISLIYYHHHHRHHYHHNRNYKS